MLNSPVIDQAANPRRIFSFLLLYRWLSLSVPVAAWLLEPDGILLAALVSAAAANTLISFYSRQLNRALRQRSWLLAADMALMAVLTAVTGGWSTPFYLHLLNPFLIAAFFFGVRGALTAVSAFLPLYAASVIVVINQVGEPLNWLQLVTAVVGLYLISGTFGFAANLVNRLQQARNDLSLSHRQLKALHELTVSLQSATDVEEVQDKVLDAITVDLGFPKAVIGLVDPHHAVITSWLGRVRDGHIGSGGGPAHPVQMPLTPDGGLVAQALLERRIHRVTELPCTADAWLNEHLQEGCYIFPLVLREHPVGALLVDVGEYLTGDNRFASLKAVAGQASVAIGTTMLCIDRAQQIAVQEERLRIAQDLHDSVSQSLFGIVYTLDGTLKLLPDQPGVAIPELARALETAEQVRAAIRHSILDIWPSELTAERFSADLRHYAQGTCPADGLQLEFDIRGEFSVLSPQARRSLYRISQEAVANIARHAQASEARVCIDVTSERAQLVVRDNGQGFEPHTALAREYGREHFGLRGIQERAKALGGECHIFSRPNEGTSIVVDIPVSEK